MELTDKGIETLSKKMKTKTTHSIGVKLQNRKSKARIKEEAALKEIPRLQRQGKRIHSMNQLFKAYTLEKDVEYVVMENKVMIVDEQTNESWMAEDILMGYTKR